MQAQREFYQPIDLHIQQSVYQAVKLNREKYFSIANLATWAQVNEAHVRVMLVWMQLQDYYHIMSAMQETFERPNQAIKAAFESRIISEQHNKLATKINLASGAAKHSYSSRGSHHVRSRNYVHPSSTHVRIFDSNVVGRYDTITESDQQCVMDVINRLFQQRGGNFAIKMVANMSQVAPLQVMLVIMSMQLQAHAHFNQRLARPKKDFMDSARDYSKRSSLVNLDFYSLLSRLANDCKHADRLERAGFSFHLELQAPELTDVQYAYSSGSPTDTSSSDTSSYTSDSSEESDSVDQLPLVSTYLKSEESVETLSSEGSSYASDSSEEAYTVNQQPLAASSMQPACPPMLDAANSSCLSVIQLAQGAGPEYYHAWGQSPIDYQGSAYYYSMIHSVYQVILQHLSYSNTYAAIVVATAFPEAIVWMPDGANESILMMLSRTQQHQVLSAMLLGANQRMTNVFAQDHNTLQGLQSIINAVVSSQPASVDARPVPSNRLSPNMLFFKQHAASCQSLKPFGQLFYGMMMAGNASSGERLLKVRLATSVMSYLMQPWLQANVSSYGEQNKMLTDRFVEESRSLKCSA